MSHHLARQEGQSQLLTGLFEHQHERLPGKGEHRRLLELPPGGSSYRALPRFPGVKVDVALAVPEDTPQAGVAEAVRAAEGGNAAAADAALARALRAALSRHLSGAEHMTPEEMLAAPELAEPLRDAALRSTRHRSPSAAKTIVPPRIEGSR